MNVLIVEDEAPAARRLRRLVANELAIDPDDISLADNLDTACQCLAELPVELLLLDLDLSGRDGFEALRSVNTNRPATVIVSANVDRALEAFDHDVVDFVSKPVSAERLSRALIRAREVRSQEMRLIIRSVGRAEIVPVGNIVRFAGADDYVEVVTTDGHNLLHYESLDRLEQQLPLTFIRTHRSHLVNAEQVVQLLVVSRGQMVAVTSDKQQVPISRRRVSMVKSRLLTGQ